MVPIRHIAASPDTTLATQDDTTPNFPIRRAALGEAFTRVAAAIVHSAIPPVKYCKLRVFSFTLPLNRFGRLLPFPIVPTGS